MSLVVKADGDVRVRLASQPEAPVSQVSWRDNNLRGTFGGTVPTSDARRWPHIILLNLRMRQGTLSGMASAQSTADREYFALTSYASLTKAKPLR